MVLIKATAFVVLEILSGEVLKQNFWLPITADISKIKKSVDRKLTFIFDVVSETVIGFVQTMVVLLKIKGTPLKEMPLNQKRGGVIMQNHGYNVRHKVFTQILPFRK